MYYHNNSSVTGRASSISVTTSLRLLIPLAGLRLLKPKGQELLSAILVVVFGGVGSLPIKIALPQAAKVSEKVTFLLSLIGTPLIKDSKDPSVSAMIMNGQPLPNANMKRMLTALLG